MMAQRKRMAPRIGRLLAYAHRGALLRRGIWPLALVYLVAAFPAIPSAPPRPGLPGYFVDPSAAAAPRPTLLEEPNGEFTRSIRRGFPDSTAARLLAVAEATYPPRDRVVQLAQEMTYELGSDTARAPLWWSRGVGVARIPYAITTGALEHYSALTESFRRRVFRAAGGRPLRSSDLTYRATIAHRDSARVSGRSYADVYVARLELRWTYDDGTFEPLIQAHRLVIVSPEGVVLAVEGDREADEEVFISSNRGGGKK